MVVNIDVAEQLALERIKKLFNCKYNVQPHSGHKRMGIFSILNRTIHLWNILIQVDTSHGKIYVGKWFNAISYDVDKNLNLLIMIMLRLVWNNQNLLLGVGFKGY